MDQQYFDERVQLYSFRRYYNLARRILDIWKDMQIILLLSSIFFDKRISPVLETD